MRWKSVSSSSSRPGPDPVTFLVNPIITSAVQSPCWVLAAAPAGEWWQKHHTLSPAMCSGNCGYYWEWVVPNPSVFSQSVLKKKHARFFVRPLSIILFAMCGPDWHPSVRTPDTDIDGRADCDQLVLTRPELSLSAQLRAGNWMLQLMRSCPGSPG